MLEVLLGAGVMLMGVIVGFCLRSATETDKRSDSEWRVAPLPLNIPLDERYIGLKTPRPKDDGGETD
jgi:hypothetical protein